MRDSLIERTEQLKTEITVLNRMIRTMKRQLLEKDQEIKALSIKLSEKEKEEQKMVEKKKPQSKKIVEAAVAE